MRKNSLRYTLSALVLVAAAVAAWAYIREGREERGPLALFTSLPIYWRETADLSAMLDPQAEPHWARTQIERTRELRPLDVLTPETLNPFEDLLLAQPRALAPAENVALDNWVRGGGHLLLFADPLLTEHSAFAIGDKRRPMDTVLLSPILDHWGLELQVDDKQPATAVIRHVMGLAVPADLSGSFATRGQANCQLWGGGFAVTCAIGKGRVVALADAAVLEAEDAGGERSAALKGLLDMAFAAR